LGMLQGPPRKLVTGQVVLFPGLPRGRTMGVRGGVVQFGRSLMILVVRSVVIAY